MNSPATDWITTPITTDLLRGFIDLERSEDGLLPHRLPAWARAQCADGQLAWAEAQSAGVRLAFRTTATVVELDTRRTKSAPPRRPAPRGRCVRPAGERFAKLAFDGPFTARASAFTS